MDITSKTDICNLALDLLSAGTVQNIDDPNDPTEELLSRWYDQTRRRVLRSHSWNFATKREILTADAAAPEFGYSLQFTVPADFLRLLSIVGPEDDYVPPSYYKVEGGKILMSDNFTVTEGAVNLKYIYDIKTVSAFDPLFIDLLAYEIALSIAFKITDTSTNVQRIAELRRIAASLAKSIDGQESPPTLIQRSPALRARRQRNGTNNHKVIF